LTDNGDGTATISSTDVVLFNNTDFVEPAAKYTIAGDTFTFTEGSEEYVVADYNSGSPIMRVETNKALINGSSIVTLLICWRQDSVIHSVDEDAYGMGLANKINRMLYNTQSYNRSIDGGLILSESSSPIARTILVSASIVYAAATPYVVSTFNSSTDLLTQVNHVGGNWTYTNVSVYDNQYYDNGTNAVLMTDNRFSNRFFYRSIGDVKQVFYTLGQIQYYNTDETYQELPPTPPLVLRDHCVYIGRIAIGKNSSTGVVHPAFDHITELPEYIFYDSSGVFTAPTIVGSSTGIITVGQGEYLLYSDSTYTENTLNKYTISGDTFTIPDDGINHYIVANYNSGSPQLELIDDMEAINQSDIIPVLSVFNLLGTILYIFWDEMAKGLSNKLCDRLVKTEQFTVEKGGLILSEVATRLVNITEGRIWYGAAYLDLPEVQSNVAGQYIALWYHSSGTWTRTTSTTYNNTQYDNGTNLVTLTNNRYAVNWIYRGFSADPVNVVQRPVSVLGQGDYTLEQAVASLEPDPLPPAIQNFCVLVGKIIVKKGDSTATVIMPLAQETTLSSVFPHNGLPGLQGGAIDEYYHLTAAEYTALGHLSFNITTQTTTYTILNTDDVILCNGTFTATLPAATGTGKVFHIKNIGTGVITVAGNGTETIDNELTQTVNSYENLQVIDGSSGNWYIL